MSAMSRHRPERPTRSSNFLCIYKIGRFDPPMAWAPATGLGTAVHCSCCLRSQALPLIRYIHRAPSFGSDPGTTRSGARTGVWCTVLAACACVRNHTHARRTHMHACTVDARDRPAIRLFVASGTDARRPNRPKRGCCMHVEPWWELANARPETCKLVKGGPVRFRQSVGRRSASGIIEARGDTL
ncbi:hypothetical protein EDB85DRAFT_585024 [Lactarius pseudohatsudake]|nr:hypothetical protein EDB85DRAFT_585024 [Lactarius pseudohatsudake]